MRQVDILDLELKLVAQLLVESAERLVHQDDMRLENEGACKRDALLLAAGKAARQTLRGMAELDHVKDFGNLAADDVLRRLAHAQREGDVLEHRHVREQRVILEHHADAAFPRWGVGSARAVDPKIARVGVQQARDHHQQRRLAGARWPEQRHEFACAKVEIRRVQRDCVAVALAQALDR